MVTTTENLMHDGVSVATAADEPRVLNALLLAFAADPAVRWMYPGTQQYLAHFASLVRAFAGPAFDHGAVFGVHAYRGVALWLPPGVQPDEEALADVIQRTVAPADCNQVFALFEQMDRYHPREPHWYLPLLGVDPAHHRRGLGSRLLQHVLRICDRDRMPAYLEATSPRNVSLYRRHGFRSMGMIRTSRSPLLVPMLRQPQQ